MYAYICPDCGAYLDPGEVCDCLDKEEAAPELTLQRRHAKSDNVIVAQNGAKRNEGN